MAELVKRTRDKVIVRPKADWNLRGKILQTAGVALALVSAPLGVWVNDQFLLIGIGAAVLVVVGLPMVLAGKRTVLDVAERNVLLANGEVMPFAQVADVELRSYIHEVTRQQGTVQHQRFRVALVTRAADPQHAERVDRARKKIEEAVAGPYGQPETTKYRELDDEISLISNSRPSGEPIVFADHADELKMWRVAERVAKTLDVPIADYCGDELVIRTPAELDVPLGERLVRIGAELDEPGALPPGLHDESTEERVLVSWPWPVWGGVIATALLGVTCALLGYVIWDDMPEIRISFGAMGAMLLLLALFLFDCRRKALEVTHDSVRYATGVWWRRGQPIPVQQLEMVRANKTLGTSLSLISDERIVRCPMPSAEAVDWASTRIEEFLAEAARSSQAER